VSKLEKSSKKKIYKIKKKFQCRNKGWEESNHVKGKGITTTTFWSREMKYGRNQSQKSQKLERCQI